ncbi:hypothetical protein M427DRAFT_39678 [Gonapodya prolifera JEL478]|uniref:Uncharacterized protein n=1 Tax=Gonapodya prolifera (strain JEL478) TaxID=1344416 RepID=A0A138ZX23_GONPJ|nr:hypothetical protein M427DRAFT_39678 [Gonapodya prolifera JEL478]|eukprot:KXS09014.1 hypothetical protein M427DRAFT_39678 [Gonapodya prolifera JEL478]
MDFDIEQDGFPPLATEDHSVASIDKDDATPSEPRSDLRLILSRVNGTPLDKEFLEALAKVAKTYGHKIDVSDAPERGECDPETDLIGTVGNATGPRKPSDIRVMPSVTNKYRQKHFLNKNGEHPSPPVHSINVRHAPADLHVAQVKRTVLTPSPIMGAIAVQRPKALRETLEQSAACLKSPEAKLTPLLQRITDTPPFQATQAVPIVSQSLDVVEVPSAPVSASTREQDLAEIRHTASSTPPPHDSAHNAANCVERNASIVSSVDSPSGEETTKSSHVPSAARMRTKATNRRQNSSAYAMQKALLHLPDQMGTNAQIIEWIENNMPEYFLGKREWKQKSSCVEASSWYSDPPS